ncbi:MAG: hypothetical protein R2942_13680 [Ignavibacteria bacterium]
MKKILILLFIVTCSSLQRSGSKRSHDLYMYSEKSDESNQTDNCGVDNTFDPSIQ